MWEALPNTGRSGLDNLVNEVSKPSGSDVNYVTLVQPIPVVKRTELSVVIYFVK